MATPRSKKAKTQIEQEEEENEPITEAGQEEPMQNGEGEGGEEGDEAEEEEDLKPRVVRVTPIRSLKVAEGEYSHGSIVRVKLRDFLTYSDVEFCPGPNLNVVIGPNGTGKSTIVCAILVGLGGRISLLGRQKYINEFIRHGKESAYVELELFIADQPQNLIISRSISKMNQSQWKMNGKSCPEKMVIGRVRDLGIQLDNLTQFLPQEAVPNFARMNEYEMLEATEKTVGNDDLYGQHRQLIELGKKEMEQRDLKEKKEKDLKKLQDLNAQLEPMVRLYRDRERQRENIKILKYKLQTLHYKAAVEKVNELQEKRDHIANQIKTLEAEDKPTMDQIKAIENELKAIDAEKKAADVALARVHERFKKNQEDSDYLADAIENKRAEIEKSLYSKKDAIKKLEKDIEQLEKAIRDVCKGDFEEERRTLKATERAAREKESSFFPLLDDISRDTNVLQGDAKQTQARLKKLDDVRSQRLTLLSRMSPPSYEGLKWLEANRKLFKQQVFEPVWLLMDVDNPRYATCLESAIKKNDLMTFVTQNEHDYELLNSELKDKLKLAVTVGLADLKTSLTPTVPLASLQKYGIECYAIDSFGAPDPVKRYLAYTNRLFDIPFGGDAADKYVRELEGLVTQFFTAKWSYFVSTSRYGAKDSQTSVRGVKGKNILSASADQHAIDECHRKLEELKAKLDELDAKRKEFQDQMDMHNSTAREASARLKLLDGIAAKQNLLNVKKKNLIAFQAQLRDLERSKENMNAEIAPMIEKRMALARAKQEMLNNLVQMAQARVRTSLKFNDLVMNKRGLEDSQNTSRRELDRCRNELRAMEQALMREKEEKKRLASIVKKFLDEYKEVLMTLSNNLEEIETKINEEETQLRMSDDVDKGTIETFERREKEISTLTRELQGFSEGYNEIASRLKALRDQWLSPLRLLVREIHSSFGKFFRKLGCAGEVHLIEHEFDYAKFGIQIKVKFRDAEPLQVLNGTHQSGGERSVSTMLYLLSLHTLSRSPFRVVDEINQGMDQHNERRVFDQIVECSSDQTSQYFLITPKLLRDLKYNEHVRVLCIYNGTHMVKHSDFSIKKMLQKIKG